MTHHRLTTLATAVVFATLLASGCARDDTASLVSSAKDYLAKSDVRAAIIQLRNARQKAPDNAEVRFLLGRALLDTGDAPAAVTELRRAYELRHPADEVVPLLAQALVTTGDSRKAISEFGSTTLADAKARASLATMLAVAHIAQADFKQARAAVQAALSADPGNVRANVALARLAVRDNDPVGAVGALDTALTTAPNDVEALVLKSELANAQGKRGEALRLLEQARLANPTSLHPRFALVSQHVGAGELDKADAVVAEMKRISPDDFRTVYSDALVRLSKGEAAKARDLSQTLLNARSDHVPTLYIAGLANYQLKNWVVAEEMLRKVIAQVPDDPGPRRVLVAGYLRAGRTTQATEAVDMALRRMPDDVVLLRLAGEARIQSGSATEAARYYERAASLEKQGNVAQLRLAQIRLATGDTGRAMGDLERLAAGDPTGVQADLALYTAHLRRREYDKALQAAASVEKKQSGTALPHELRGIVYSFQRKMKEARIEFERALEIDPKRLASARSLAMIDLQEGKAANAQARYEKMIQADPKAEQPIIALAEVQALSGAPPADVKATLERAIAANPGAPGARVALVTHYRRIGDAKAALESARAAVTALPGEAGLLELFGALQLSTGESAQARDTFTRLSQLMPNSPVPLLRLSEAHVANRDFVSALDVQRKALALQPDYMPTVVAIATTYLIAGKPDDAVAEARKLQRERPKAAIGYTLEAEILTAQKKFAEATVPMKEALARQPSAMLATRQFALLNAAERSSEANAFADRWMKEHPKDAAFLSMVGQQRQSRKDVAGATAAYRAALDIDPDNIIVLNNLAWMLNEQGRPEAREYAERAFRLAPLQPNVVDTYGTVLVRSGDTKRGLEMIRMAMNLQPGDARFRVNYARGLAKTGDKAGARRELEQVVSTSPGSPAKAEAEQLLRQL